MKQVRILISGRVQGVGYRAWIRQKAVAHNIVGWVRNTDDGAVEAILEGPETVLKKLAHLLKTGPMLAKVETIDKSWSEGTGEFKSFEIRTD